ncbi:hypothetical protein Tco_0751269 [Tanacetum coccineum]|uniref:Uncharacterized protein n=1 Tax=Tanacetum coccineum TaxID=301880 RepID=A0ABQ4Z770_9ASTR
MLPTRRATRTTPATTTNPTTTVTEAQLQALIDQGVAAALAERDASRSRDGDNSHEKGKNQIDWKQKVVAPKAGNEVLMIDEGWSPPHYQETELQHKADISFTSDDPRKLCIDNVRALFPTVGRRDKFITPITNITSNYTGKGRKIITTDFMIVRAPSPYNVILGRPGMRQLGAIASMIHSLIKFPLKSGIAIIRGDVPHKSRCLQISHKR